MMNKTLLFAIISLLSASTISVSAQTQTGFVKTRGRLGANSQVIHGTRLAGTTISLNKRNVVSAQQGTFSFPVTDGKYIITNVSKNGYKLVDVETLRQYSYSKDSLIIVMYNLSEFENDKLDVERTIRRNLEKRLRESEERIEKLLEDNKISQEEYRQQYNEIYSNQDNATQLIRDMAEKFASTDYDRLDEFNRRINEYILNGELIKADSLLKSKGNIHKRVADYRKLKKTNDEQKEELTRRQKRLEKSIQYAQRSLEDIAQDCYSHFEICKMKFDNDSAQYWISLRSDLDTLNVKWMLDATEFIYRYKADYPLALEYCQRAMSAATKADGEISQNVATVHNDMGLIYGRQGRYDEAMNQHKRALAIRLSVFGETNNNTAISYCNIGDVCQNKALYDEALSYFEKALAICKELYGEDHTDIATLYNNIANIYNYKNDFKLAIEYIKRAIDISLKAYGENHPDVAIF